MKRCLVLSRFWNSDLVFGCIYFGSGGADA